MAKIHQHTLYTCVNCGSKFELDTSGGVCPYCHASDEYLLDAYRMIRKKQAARKRQIKKAVFRLSLIGIAAAVLIIGLVILISSIVKGSETLVYSVGNYSKEPYFFTDSDGQVFYLNPNNQSILIGKGYVSGFSSSNNGKDVYFVFEGTRDLDSLGRDSSLLLRIKDFSSVSTVAESPYGKITFSSGGNCRYIYYLVNETLSTYQSSSRLYVFDADTGKTDRIAEYDSVGKYTNFRVSANGRYLLYKAEDDSGTKLMKYSVKTGESENIGVKNAEPVSIDNKGKYLSYVKQNEGGALDFYVESNVSDREKTALDTATVERILLSSDFRSFVIETGDIVFIKSVGVDPITIVSSAGSGIGIAINEYASYAPYAQADESHIGEILLCDNRSFVPYTYVEKLNDGTYCLMTCDKSGDKKPLIDDYFINFVTNNDMIAYIAEDSLYTVKISENTAEKNFVTQNFSRYTLRSISDNGKYVYLNDEDGNFYRSLISSDKFGFDRIAVDADAFAASKDGKLTGYIADGILSYRNSAGQSARLSESVNRSAVFLSHNLSRIVYLASTEDSKAENAYTLFAFNGKTNSKIRTNVGFIMTYPHLILGFSDTPYGEKPIFTDTEDAPLTTDEEDGESRPYEENSLTY